MRSSPDLCKFLHRCPARIDGVCNVQPPMHRIVRNDKEILCHHTDAELQRLYVREPELEDVS